MLKIGFIGFGEAAFNISAGLKAENGKTAPEIKANDALMRDPVMGKQVTDRAKEADVVLEEDKRRLVEWADMVIASVPSSYTLGVCESVKDFLKPGQLYVDVSASTPKTKETVWALIQDKGVLFADAAMMGSLPKDKHKVPITATGNGAAKFIELMSPFGMKITLAGDKPGDASAIKLVRSIYMKGIAALMIETFRAADAYGISDKILSSISTSMDGISFESHLNRLVTGTAIHCHRRAAELKGSLELLAEAGLESPMTAAAKAVHESLEPFSFAAKYAGSKPKDAEEIIEAIRPEK